LESESKAAEAKALFLALNRLVSALISAFLKASFTAISAGSLTAFAQTLSMTSYPTFLYTFDLAVVIRLILRLS
jgi:hypothetical protein